MIITGFYVNQKVNERIERAKVKTALVYSMVSTGTLLTVSAVVDILRNSYFLLTEGQEMNPISLIKLAVAIIVTSAALMYKDMKLNDEKLVLREINQKLMEGQDLSFIDSEEKLEQYVANQMSILRLERSQRNISYNNASKRELH